MAIIKNKAVIGLGEGDLDAIKREVFLSMYPIGSIFITVSSIEPSTVFGGTWEKLPDGYYLRASTVGDGSQLGEELPNITGQVSFASGSQGHPEMSGASGAFQTSSSGNLTYPEPSGSSGGSRILKINASNMTNSVYKTNGSVQPKSIKVYMYKRIS